ncbi:MAG TPA: hypothetical protein VNK49_10815 [Anaerolineales bacterium]|nr:hypothetical protein [Anaerolineales bacterium]
MGSKRNVSLSAALQYKGQGTYLAYILHRLGGSALFLFFTIYILTLIGVASAQAIFGHWLVQIVLLVFGLFHAINGLRITLLDLFPQWISNYRTVMRIEWTAYLLLAGLMLFIVLRNTWGG